MSKLDEQIEKLLELGYVFNNGNNKTTILEMFKKTFFGDVLGTVEEQFLGIHIDRFVNNKPFHQLYFYLGAWNESEKNYITDNCLWWEFDMFGGDGKIEYVEFMKRMGVISRGELKFTDINCFFEEGEICTRYITFTVNGIAKRWNLGNADYIPDSYILRFALLCEELNTKGKYTIYDDGGILFVLDYATEEEQNKFNEVTKLGRIWLKDGNHFSTPID